MHVKYSTPHTENPLKTKYMVKNGINSCDKGLTQEMVTIATTVTSTMQIVEYHVKYNTITNQTHLKQTTIVLGVRVNLKKGLPL